MFKVSCGLILLMVFNDLLMTILIRSTVVNHADDLFYALYADQDGAVQTVTIGLDGNVSQATQIDTSILGGKLGDILGSAWSNNTLFALTNNNMILAIEDNVVTQVFALDYAADTSGLAVYAGSLYLVTDHEYYQAQPPIKVFDLPNQEMLRSS